MSSRMIDAIEAAADALDAADFVLIAAGAGFSADSGLPVYDDVAKHPGSPVPRPRGAGLMPGTDWINEVVHQSAQ